MGPHVVGDEPSQVGAGVLEQSEELLVELPQLVEAGVVREDTPNVGDIQPPRRGLRPREPIRDAVGAAGDAVDDLPKVLTMLSV